MWRSGRPSASVFCVDAKRKATRSAAVSRAVTSQEESRAATCETQTSPKSHANVAGGTPNPSEKVLQKVQKTVSSSKLSDARESSFFRAAMVFISAGRASWPTKSGSSTFLLREATASAKGNAPVCPTIRSRSKGETKIPNRFPSTALKMAIASFPLADRVSATHMLTVVGSADMTNKPSLRPLLTRPRPDSAETNANIPRGSAHRLKACRPKCVRTLDAASAS
mmetsp:Transcript_36567/g.85407  ORF Transcript_36567/g.85407 Transcript_36567/m.85407 type:complete len:224 (-) Transcript_36567:466-1137(-)